MSPKRVLSQGRGEEEQVDQLGGSKGEGRAQGDGSLDTVFIKMSISNGEGGALGGGAQNDVLPQAVLLSGEGGGEEDKVDS